MMMMTCPVQRSWQVSGAALVPHIRHSCELQREETVNTVLWMFSFGRLCSLRQYDGLPPASCQSPLGPSGCPGVPLNPRQLKGPSAIVSTQSRCTWFKLTQVLNLAHSAQPTVDSHPCSGKGFSKGRLAGRTVSAPWGHLRGTTWTHYSVRGRELVTALFRFPGLPSVPRRRQHPLLGCPGGSIHDLPQEL